MPSQTVTVAIADRLRREAERLEQIWDAPDLDTGFVSDQVLAVLRFLDRVGSQGRCRDEQAEFAAVLLRGFCRRNGRRDTARAIESRRTGMRPAFVSLDALLEQGWDTPGTHPQADWLREEVELEVSHTLPQDLARFLEGCGWARERAWMFVWAEYEGLEWKEVARLMEERFEVRATTIALRKWAERNWAAVRADATDFHALCRAGDETTLPRQASRDVTEWVTSGIPCLEANSDAGDIIHSTRTRRKEVTPMGN